MAERDDLVVHPVGDVVPTRRQVGIELYTGPHLERVGNALRRLGVECGPHGQPRDLGLEEQALAFVAQQEIDEPAGAFGVRRALDHGDVGRHHRRQGGIDEVYRLPGRDGREPEEVNHDAYAVVAGDHGLGNAERALGDRAHVATHLYQQLPALLPAVSLQDRLNGQVGGAAAARGGDDQVAEVLGFDQIIPFLGRG